MLLFRVTFFSRDLQQICEKTVWVRSKIAIKKDYHSCLPQIYPFFKTALFDVPQSKEIRHLASLAFFRRFYQYLHSIYSTFSYNKFAG